MLKSIPSVLLVVVALPSSAQVSDTVTVGPAYANQTWYDISTQTQTTASAAEWDLQIATNLFSASLRVNDGNGVQLYAPANQDTGTWTTLDTTGMTPLYNSDQDWEVGALNAQAGTHPDYGWGTYISGGNITGTKLFVIKLHDGARKKVWIVSLAVGNTYTIRHADLDNSNDVITTVTKTSYSGKSFVYVDLVSDVIHDDEPAANDWDLLFRRYSAELSPGVFYPVVGVQQNYNGGVAEARGVDVNSDDYSGFSFDSSITVIGHDWKTFNMTTFQWEIEDSLVYFLNDSGTIYKIIFTDFGGSANGDFIFALEELSVGMDDLRDAPLVLFPIPATDQLNVVIPDGTPATIDVVDLNGGVLISQHAPAGIAAVDVSNLAAGIYMVTVHIENSVRTQRLIVQ